MDVQAEVTHKTDAAEAIRAKIERMHQDVVEEQISAMEDEFPHSITEKPEELEAELVEDDDPEKDAA